eukprot:Skav220424  [mRNA]  locus=scaffold639:728770:729030:+ [translate_table: standard]
MHELSPQSWCLEPFCLAHDLQQELVQLRSYTGFSLKEADRWTEHWADMWNCKTPDHRHPAFLDVSFADRVTQIRKAKVIFEGRTNS